MIQYTDIALAQKVGQMPWLDKMLHKNPLIGFIAGLVSTPKVSPVLKFALEQIANRKSERLREQEKNEQRRDFLSRFLDIKDVNPDIPDS